MYTLWMSAVRPDRLGRLSGSRWFTLDATLAYLAWYAFCVACWYILPGEKVEGNLLRDGTRNVYKMNGELFGSAEGRNHLKRVGVIIVQASTPFF
jgi:hypothetical protein